MCRGNIIHTHMQKHPNTPAHSAICTSSHLCPSFTQGNSDTLAYMPQRDMGTWDTEMPCCSEWQVWLWYLTPRRPPFQCLFCYKIDLGRGLGSRQGFSKPQTGPTQPKFSSSEQKISCTPPAPQPWYQLPLPWLCVHGQSLPLSGPSPLAEAGLSSTTKGNLGDPGERRGQ